MQRAARIGFTITKVVYRGYHASEKLQKMHDNAIETRTALRLDADTQVSRKRAYVSIYACVCVCVLFNAVISPNLYHLLPSIFIVTISKHTIKYDSTILLLCCRPKRKIWPTRNSAKRSSALKNAELSIKKRKSTSSKSSRLKTHKSSTISRCEAV